MEQGEEYQEEDAELDEEASYEEEGMMLSGISSSQLSAFGMSLEAASQRARVLWRVPHITIMKLPESYARWNPGSYYCNPLRDWIG